jgi:hypothetical protein
VAGRPGSEVQAARTVLERAMRTVDLLDTEERVRALEAKIEAAFEAACPMCHGRPMRLEWERDWSKPQGDTAGKHPDDPERCARCVRPLQVVKVRWKSNANPEDER